MKTTNRDKSNKKLINYLFIITFIILLSLIPGAFYFSTLSMDNTIIINDINGINIILGILAIISCAFYYNMYKGELFFIITLNYLIIYIEYIVVNILLKENCIYFLTVENMLTVPFCIRIILLTLVLLNKGSLTQFIINKKKWFILIVLSINGLGILIELYLKGTFIALNNSNLLLFLNMALMLYYFILLILLSNRAYQENKFIYAIITSSLSIIISRRLFCAGIFPLDTTILIQYNRFLSFIAFTILIIGLFIKIDIKVKDNEFLRNEVENSEKILSAITTNIKELIFLEDINGNIIYVNNAAISALGYSMDDLLGFPVKNILHSQTNKIHNEDYNILFVEEEWKCKNGQILSTESIINTILDDNKNLVGKMIVARDSSFKSELDKLKIKYKEIQELEIIRTQFFANLSHEIRTPINIIYSCIQLLENKQSISNEALALAYKKYDSTIKQNCFRMLRLVNNIVDITKIDAGFMKVQFSNYDIVRLVENITLSIVPYVESKKINVIFDTIVEELEIKCDPDTIERIILNLLSNSVKYTDTNGNILVSIDCDEKWVTIKVKDDGVGIPPHFKEIVFERFIQTDKSFNRQKEGSGIGLALSKSLVNLHDGEIYLSDNIDKGSEFIIKLPNVKLESATENAFNPMLETSEKSIFEKISIEFSDIYDLS